MFRYLNRALFVDDYFFDLKHILKEKSHDEGLVHELKALLGFGVTTTEMKFGIYSSISCVAALNLPINQLASGFLERDHPHERKPDSCRRQGLWREVILLYTSLGSE